MNPNNENVQNEQENKEELTENTTGEDIKVTIFLLISDRIKEKKTN